MREHLYRGKCIDSGEWVEGSYVKAHKWFGDGKPGYFIYDAYGENRTLVDPETVSEFTGLHDKNGKRIFEGDIARYRGVHFYRKLTHQNITKRGFWVGEVIFEDGEFYPVPNYRDDVTDFEVIGNKWDNPELEA